MHDKVMGWTQTGVTEAYAQSLTVTLIHQHGFYLQCINCIVMMIFCAKLFINPTIHDKVMSQTRNSLTEAYAQSLSADCDLDF